MMKHVFFSRGDVEGSAVVGHPKDDDDGPGGDIWISKPKTGGKIVALSGLGVDWNGPALMQDGTFLHPGDSEATFQNVPSYFNGATYFGHPMEVSAGNGTIQFEPPTTMYFWLKDGYTNSLELVLPTCGWKEESAPGFQTSDGSKLMVFSKYFEEADKYSGCYESFRTISSYFCGGVVGVYPLPKEPKMVDSESAKPDAEFILEGEPPESGGGVTSCSGLDIEWNAPAKITEGTLVNPGKPSGLGAFMATCVKLFMFVYLFELEQFVRASDFTMSSRQLSIVHASSWEFLTGAQPMQVSETSSLRTYLHSCPEAHTLVARPGHHQAPGPSTTKPQQLCMCGSRRVSTMRELMMH